MRARRALAAGLAAAGLLLTGAASCDDGGPGVSDSGERGDDTGTGGEIGSEDDPGEGGAGDEIGGGGGGDS